MNFLHASIDWFTRQRVSHMGPYQYASHKGLRDGRSMSGAALWAAAEAERVAAQGNMVSTETDLLHRVAREIGAHIPDGIPIIDLGPGTAAAFTHKTLPLARALNSPTCVLVDESTAFLRQIAELPAPGIILRPVIDDFFANETAYAPEPALACSFGSTISNIVNPVDDALPHTALTGSLAALANATENGWLLIGFDSDHDGPRIQNYFRKHALFQLNILDRMTAELPIAGDFDANSFLYDPQWIEASGQLAHMAVAARDMRFTLAGTPVELSAGDRLHIKNSYKFTPGFFEACCEAAGLERVVAWSDASTAKIYLLKVPAIRRILAQAA
ncbi:MAG: L-histidine N(alpha)-methyltransferase [Alphaproteobacteria bacterium]|nr:L-histidine N(alpha)-methyltransferase [Alphaproteobacteria bacterium]